MLRTPTTPWIALVTLATGAFLAGKLPQQSFAATLRALAPGACALELADAAGRPAAETVVILEHASGARVEYTSNGSGGVLAEGLVSGHWTVRPWRRDLQCSPAGFHVEAASTAVARLVVYPRERRSSTSTTSR